MADSVIKIRIDSQEYDAKLKKAGDALNRYFNTVKQGDGTLKHLDDGVMEAVQAFGKMETASQSAKGKLREMTDAFTNMASQFKQLSAEERNSPFGKALSSSLDQLKGRITDARQQLAGINSELGGGGSGKMDGMLAVFGGNIMTKVATGIATFASTAVDNIKEVVNQGIELARQGEGIRIAFDRLNRPDLLDKLREATHGTVTDLELMKQAVKFSDFNLPLSEMGTMLAFAQQKAKDTGQSVDYMVDSIVTGLGRKSLMILDNLGLSAAEIKERMKETGDMTKAVGAIIRDQMAAAGEHIETAADRAKKADVDMQNAMEELGRTFLPLKEAGESMFNSLAIAAINALNKMRPFFDQFSEAGRIRQAMEAQGGSERVTGEINKLKASRSAGSGYYSSYLYKSTLGNYDKEISKLEFSIAANSKDKDAMSRGRVARLREELQAVKDLRAEYVKQADAVFNPATKGTTTTAGETKTKAKAGTKTAMTELQTNQKKINDLELEYVKLGDDATQGARERQAEIQREIELLAKRNGLLEKRAEQAHGRLTLSAGDFQRDGLRVGGSLFGEPDSSKPKMLDDKAIKAANKNINNSLKTTSIVDAGNEVADSWGVAAQAIGQAGNALSAIKDPELNAAATVAKAVASIALGFAQAAASPATTAAGVWGWIAAAVGGLATMISTIETIHSATGFAQGGLVRAANGYAVPGNYMSTDKVPILANSGELILNRAQQGNIAAQLTGSGGGTAVGGTPYVSGEQIYLGLSNYMKRTGRGEIVTSR